MPQGTKRQVRKARVQNVWRLAPSAGILVGRMASAEGGSVLSRVKHIYGKGCPLRSRLRGLEERREPSPRPKTDFDVLLRPQNALFVPWQNLRGTICIIVPWSKFWGTCPSSPRDLRPWSARGHVQSSKANAHPVKRPRQGHCSYPRATLL